MSAASQDSPHDGKENRKEEKYQHKRNMLAPAAPCLSFSLKFTFRDFNDRINSRTDTSGKIAFPKMGSDNTPYDLIGKCIRQRSFQPVSHLDPDLVIIFRDEKKNPVVPSLLSELVLFADRHRVVLNGLVARRGDQEHDKLIRRLLLERRELLFQRLQFGAGESPGEVGNAVMKLRNILSVKRSAGTPYGKGENSNKCETRRHLELNLRGLFRSRFRLEVLLLRKSKNACKDHRRECPDLHVIVLNDFIKPAALDSDAVFGSLEL